RGLKQHVPDAGHASGGRLVRNDDLVPARDAKRIVGRRKSGGLRRITSHLGSVIVSAPPGPCEYVFGAARRHRKEWEIGRRGRRGRRGKRVSGRGFLHGSGTKLRVLCVLGGCSLSRVRSKASRLRRAARQLLRFGRSG